MKLWHAMDAADVARELNSNSETGLSVSEAVARFMQFGPNELRKKTSFRALRILWEQIQSPLVFILIAAGGISWWLGDTADTVIIAITVAINTAIGAYQEGRASRAFEKLRATLETHAIVRRDGKELEVDARTIVPGDILLLQDGNRVPADARLLDEKGLEINEAAFTGEWAPVSKSLSILPEKARIPERTNMAWMGTLVTEGRATAIVVATGNASEFGKIAKSVEDEKRELTPFQRGVAGLARTIGIFILSIIAVIFILGILRGHSAAEMFLTSVAIAVAAIPEGLPVAVTVVLAIGMYRILGQGGLVRKLIAAETLGSTSIILTDKTGTLTTGEMRVASIITSTQTLAPHEGQTPDAREILSAAMRASAAFIENPEDEMTRWRVRGKPTDRALLLAGIESGIRPRELEAAMPRMDSMPFDAERRFAASLHTTERENRLYFSGAPETLLEHSTRVLKSGQETELDAAQKKMLLDANQRSAEHGMRIIAVARLETTESEISRKAGGLRNLTFLGLIAFHDPVRPDVRDVITQAQHAGIRTIIVTGDHRATAHAVAEECGLFSPKSAAKLVEGPDIEGKSDEELKTLVPGVAVFARVLPHQKLSIANAWKANGAIVAMTGDGINDAPALHGADIGVALGSGTDVAKEASDMVLLHDSFSVIVRAIEEGRVILDNLRKIITYLLATNFSEIFLIGGALFFGLPVPILPGQILWTNIAEEGFMNFALAFEPKEKDVLRRDPRLHSSKKLLTPEMYFLIFGVGILTSLFLFGMYVFLLRKNIDLAQIRTIMFVGVSLDALLFSFSFKSLRRPLWRTNIFNNRYFFAALAASLSVLASAIYIPVLRDLLKLESLHPAALAALLAIGLFNVAAVEIGKWIFIRRSQNGAIEL